MSAAAVADGSVRKGVGGRAISPRMSQNGVGNDSYDGAHRNSLVESLGGSCFIATLRDGFVGVTSLASKLLSTCFMGARHQGCIGHGHGLYVPVSPRWDGR